MNPLIQSWLIQSFAIFLLIGSLAGMFVGTLLMYRPHWLQMAGHLLNRWVSTRHLDRSLERSVSIDPWFYRYRRVSGSLTLLGAVYVLYFFTVDLDRTNTINGLAKHFSLPASLVGVMLDAFVLSAMLGALCAAFVAIFMLIRPSMLREFEQGANRWVSLRRSLKLAEVSRGNLDEYVFQHNRRAGFLLLLGSLYVMVLLTIWFSRHQLA